ncbi:spore protease YyaC [Paenibacillus hemerocallicola]|uniref:Spore protease YyaC n=1 Tax=Paenibacillus hemerocallicola TaxID=1172614 RepID=A0A5C4T388_9BACL|nr:spore protease YyaC [Paenibacillus hemerocallicola]TNJ62737.1 spore protease YyaC [Paenibacillus hemerocallicola]
MGLEPVRQKVKGDRLPEFFRYIRDQGIDAEHIVFVCIGTDRSTGDALGPLVGTFLREAGYGQVIGTLDAPCDASNLEQRLNEIPQGRIVVAIDACLGLSTSIGLFQVANHPLEPGKSVGRTLPPVGRFSIAAIVNADGPKQYWILQSTSLYRVMTMAREIAAAVRTVFPI